ncbi:unnamed protein product, partial [Prorocentrum cordatum]
MPSPPALSWPPPSARARASGDEAGPGAEWSSTGSEGEAPAGAGGPPLPPAGREGREEAPAGGGAPPPEGCPEDGAGPREEGCPEAEADWPAGEQQAGDEWGVNLALGCPAEASSAAAEDRAVEKPGDCQAACAVDGSPDTRWVSEPEDEQWIYVDLGAERAVLRVDVRWEFACCETYTVNGSLDLEEWTPLAEEPGREGWVSTALPPDTWARWVSIYCSRRTTERGFSIQCWASTRPPCRSPPTSPRSQRRPRSTRQQTEPSPPPPRAAIPSRRSPRRRLRSTRSPRVWPKSSSGSSCTRSGGSCTVPSPPARRRVRGRSGCCSRPVRTWSPPATSSRQCETLEHCTTPRSPGSRSRQTGSVWQPRRARRRAAGCRPPPPRRWSPQSSCG